MDKIAKEIAELLAAAVTVGMTARGRRPASVTVRFDDGEKMSTLIPPMDAPASTTAAKWEPSAFQVRILDALKGRALKSEPLAHELGVDRRRLYRELGIRELIERGLVGKDLHSGYYSREFPPERFE